MGVGRPVAAIDRLRRYVDVYRRNRHVFEICRCRGHVRADMLILGLDIYTLVAPVHDEAPGPAQQDTSSGRGELRR